MQKLSFVRVINFSFFYYKKYNWYSCLFFVRNFVYIYSFWLIGFKSRLTFYYVISSLFVVLSFVWMPFSIFISINVYLKNIDLSYFQIVYEN